MAEDIVNGMTGEDDEGETCNNDKRGKDEKNKKVWKEKSRNYCQQFIHDNYNNHNYLTLIRGEAARI